MSVARTALGILRGDEQSLSRAVAAPTPGLTNLTGTVRPGAGSGSIGGSLRLPTEAAGYSSSAIAYRCVSMIAQNAASVPLTVLTGDQPSDEHPTATLWNTSTPGAPVSARVRNETMIAQAELAGESFAYLDRGATGAGTPSAMHVIYDQVDVIVDGRQTDSTARFLTGQLVGFVVRRGSTRIALLPDEVLWLRYPDPFDQWRSLAPWKAALYAVESDAYARAWQQAEFKNGARPSSVVYLGDLDQQAHDSAVAEFRTKVEGPSNAGKSLLVSGQGSAAKVERLSLTPAEMSYLDSRAANAEEVMVAFGIRRDLLLGQATYENQRAAKVSLWSDRLVPLLDTLGSEIDRQLLPHPNQEAAFDLSAVEALRENVDAVYGRMRGIAYADVLTLDEMRAELGHDPLPGGQGGLTLSAYRKVLDVEQLKAIAALGVTLSGNESGSGERSSLLPTPRRYLRAARRGAFVTARPPVVRAVQVAPQVRVKKPTAASVLALYDRLEKPGVRALAALAKRQEKAVLASLKKVKRSDPQWQPDPVEEGRRLASRREDLIAQGVDPAELVVPLAGSPSTTRAAADDVFDVTFWKGQTSEALRAFLEGAWTRGAEEAAALFGFDLDLYLDPVLEAMDDRLVVLADQVTDTTRAVLQAQLLQGGVEGGESVDELADRVRNVFGDLGNYRAETIARTEVVGGFNAASQQTAVAGSKDHDLTLVKVWLSTSDSRTRKSHERLDGERVALGKKFSNRCEFPGDSGGPADETINCRCVLLYEET